MSFLYSYWYCFYCYLDFDHREMFAEDVAQFYPFIRAVVTEEGSCARNILHGFLRFHLISPESRNLLGFYCRAPIVYDIMLLTWVLLPRDWPLKYHTNS